VTSNAAITSGTRRRWTGWRNPSLVAGREEGQGTAAREVAGVRGAGGRQSNGTLRTEVARLARVRTRGDRHATWENPSPSAWWCRATVRQVVRAPQMERRITRGVNVVGDALADADQAIEEAIQAKANYIEIAVESISAISSGMATAKAETPMSPMRMCSPL
jgi:hypothetical protein